MLLDWGEKKNIIYGCKTLELAASSTKEIFSLVYAKIGPMYALNKVDNISIIHYKLDQIPSNHLLELLIDGLEIQETDQFNKTAVFYAGQVNVLCVLKFLAIDFVINNLILCESLEFIDSDRTIKNQFNAFVNEVNKMKNMSIRINCLGNIIPITTILDKNSRLGAIKIFESPDFNQALIKNIESSQTIIHFKNIFKKIIIKSAKARKVQIEEEDRIASVIKDSFPDLVVNKIKENIFNSVQIKKKHVKKLILKNLLVDENY